MPSSVQSLSHVQLFASPQTAACQASLSITNSQGLLKLMSTASCPLHQWCHPTISSSVVPFSSCPQSFPAAGSFTMSQLLTSGGHKYQSFSFSISPFNEYLGLISFRIDWFPIVMITSIELALGLLTLHLSHWWIWCTLTQFMWKPANAVVFRVRKVR